MRLRSLVPVLSLMGSLVAATWVFRRTGADLADALGHMSLAAHALALAVFALEVTARGGRVAVVARGLGIPLRLGPSVAAQIAGDTLGALTPSRVGSDPAKILWLRRASVPVGAAGALLLAEISLEAMALVGIAVLVVSGPPDTRWVALGILGYALTVTSAAGGALFLSRLRGRDGSRRILGIRVGAARLAALRQLAREFRAHAARLRTLPRSYLIGAGLLTLAHIGARLAVLPIIVAPWSRAGELTVLPETGLILLPLFLFYATALLPPPGGGGGVEAGFALLLGDTLGSGAVAPALIWWRFYTFYLGVALGAILFVARRGLPPSVLAVGSDTGPSREGRATFSASPPAV